MNFVHPIPNVIHSVNPLALRFQLRNPRRQVCARDGFGIGDEGGLHEVTFERTVNYYNDNDPKVCAWLKELCGEFLLVPGRIDSRSILDVIPNELSEFTQCHFFAGIGGWPRALGLAGWPDDRAVWTASCPCQPFSAAGKGAGVADERHLWPAFKWLVEQCRPSTIFGEQVASNLGREWLAGVRVDLERMGYEVGAADLCAASKGAPHIRQRLYWVADSDMSRSWALERMLRENNSDEAANASFNCSSDGGLGDANDSGSQAGAGGSWSDYELVPLRDGTSRRTQPGIFPLAYGFPNRMGLLRGYGNAVVPEVAAEFIKTFLDL